MGFLRKTEKIKKQKKGLAEALDPVKAKLRVEGLRARSQDQVWL